MDSDSDFTGSDSVETPVRPSRHGDCPSHDAGVGVDVNSILVTAPVNCRSNHSAGASFDVGENSNIDFPDLSVVNDSININGSVTATNDSTIACNDLNVNALFDTTSGAPLNVEVTVAGSVYHRLKTVTVEATEKSGVNVDTYCEINSCSNKTAAVTCSKDVHSIFKTVNVKATANSGVNVNTRCDSNIGINSCSNKTAAVTSSENAHSIFKTVNVHATAKSGVLVSAHSNSNVNVSTV